MLDFPTNPILENEMTPDWRPEGQRVNILLVDDRYDKLLALESILAGLSENLVLARSGSEALRLLLHEDFALIILDVSMPGMDGFETAALIRQRKNSELTPIIFISAINYSETHLSRGYSLGAIDYILAPIVPEILRAKVSFFIELHKKTEQLKRQAEVETKLAWAETARAQAEAANKAKDRFIAILSHELRTPLTPILLSSLVLSQDPNLPASIRKELEMIARNVQLEARLIEDLLDLTRISRGKFSLCLEKVDADSLLEAALDVCADELSDKQLVVQRETIGSQCCLFADAARLQQVFWNLIKNSIKFSPPGETITVRSSIPRPGWWRAEVIDHGVGIESSALDKIFEAFEQVARDQTGGLGLGLTISKAIVDLHSGTVSAASEGIGKGAVFTIDLPVYDRALDTSSGQICIEPLISDDLPAERSSLGRILIVDDHADTVEAMSSFLLKNGYQVVTASSVSSALRLVEQSKPIDLMLSDIGLPEGGGLYLLSELRKRGYQFPAVALSGYGMEDDLNRSILAGFKAHLTKPVSPVHLKRTVKEFLPAR
ncbi:MAG: response regulator [Verrucomicrobia bacterium]|nr:response regulator [Verrucomicrobiota bacterium]